MPLLIALAISLLFLVGLAFYAYMLRSALNAKSAQNTALEKENTNLQNQNLECRENFHKLKEQVSILQTQLQAKEEKILELQSSYELRTREQKEDYHAQITELRAQYQNNITTLKEELHKNIQEQNQSLLAQNKNLINEDSKKILSEIFDPLKERIKSYEKRLGENEVILGQQIRQVFDFSKNISDNANNLANILKGDKKIRGNFGEIQLKNVLENSGLVKGEQYKLQESLKWENARYVPDAIIYLERDKSVIVDAKFSLPSNLDFQRLDDGVGGELSQNLRARIDELAKKPYKQLGDYSFVLLFIPYQNLLDLALDKDPSLYQYAYNQEVYLTTPHTLFMALKTINLTWLNIRRDENISKAFEEIGKFYDKFCGIVQNFEEMKRHLNSLQKSADGLDNKLISGSGNLSTRFEQLKTLGIKTQKSLAQHNKSLLS
ncbi:DNA recombination protein [Helicobacter mustelae]|uniref:Putative DNA recombination protein n=2 Tax=Helicobacter mustelae TaxID=217 RepID=D3UJB0_HELM1|nr:DNA recombination protein RmuC [Helicobacter mustelae]CBG40585.1 putative DNA recombination protein [Helicobacter mustelae 12198]SQH72082.1 DNA recombination protein [Helicobacter mustelae]STP13226.1 DNA recombination protein [Helicobacter mustelae]